MTTIWLIDYELRTALYVVLFTSTNNQIKYLELGPLESEHIPENPNTCIIKRKELVDVTKMWVSESD